MSGTKTGDQRDIFGVEADKFSVSGVSKQSAMKGKVKDHCRSYTRIGLEFILFERSGVRTAVE